MLTQITVEVGFQGAPRLVQQALGREVAARRQWLSQCNLFTFQPFEVEFRFGWDSEGAGIGSLAIFFTEDNHRFRCGEVIFQGEIGQRPQICQV